MPRPAGRQPTQASAGAGTPAVFSRRFDKARAVAVAPNGAVWVGTYAAGLVRWADTGGSYVAHSLPRPELGKVSALAVDGHGAVWAATSRSGGVWRFDDKRWTHHTTDDGLAGNGVESLAVDADGRVWAATSNGVSRFDGRRWASHTTTN